MTIKICLLMLIFCVVCLLLPLMSVRGPRNEVLRNKAVKGEIMTVLAWVTFSCSGQSYSFRRRIKQIQY